MVLTFLTGWTAEEAMAHTDKNVDILDDFVFLLLLPFRLLLLWSWFQYSNSFLLVLFMDSWFAYSEAF